MYPSEETARRNRWQDEYDAATREHAWATEEVSSTWHIHGAERTEWLLSLTDDEDDIPADIKHAFEE